MAQRHVNLLKKAKRYLNKDDALFVCHALDRACDNRDKTKNQIKQYIYKVISPHTSVGDWLKNKGYDYGFYADSDAINYRRRWIQHMIDNHEEFFGKD